MAVSRLTFDITRKGPTAARTAPPGVGVVGGTFYLIPGKGFDGKVRLEVSPDHKSFVPAIDDFGQLLELSEAGCTGIGVQGVSFRVNCLERGKGKAQAVILLP